MDKLNKNFVYKRNNKRLLKKIFVSLIFIAGLVIIGYVYFWQYDQIVKLNKRVDDLSKQTDSKKDNITIITDYLSPKSVSVKIFSPSSGSNVSSPLVVMGQIPGNWSFEASFPVKLKNSAGTIIAQGTAQVMGDWMTTNLVPFYAELKWSSSESGSGTLELQKDNPSGLAENDDFVSIPVKF